MHSVSDLRRVEKSGDFYVNTALQAEILMN